MELCFDRDLGVPRPGAQTQRSAAPGVVFHREQRGTRSARADSVRPDLCAGHALPLVELHLARCSDGRAVLPRRQLDLGKGQLVGAKLNSYDIHGIVSVTSTVALPELERFRVDALVEAPTISVQIGKMSHEAPHRFSRRLEYDEGLGSAGFATQITIGRRTDIVASKLLKHSPHVLYTNIVEPVLRWTFVEHGYALVHAACLAVGDRAFLITARTDTGKTTTILKTLDSQPACSFLSDDLILIHPDGYVLSYPKPLTISRHTVQAVRRRCFRGGERLTLVFQSRLHSRSGRQFAFVLTRTGLPVATINAIVQAIVPPPKYTSTASFRRPRAPLARRSPGWW